MDEARERKALISGWGHEFCVCSILGAEVEFVSLGVGARWWLWRSSYKLGWELGLMSGIRIGVLDNIICQLVIDMVRCHW